MIWALRISSFESDLSVWQALIVVGGAQIPAGHQIIKILKNTNVSSLNEFIEQSSGYPRLLLQRGPPAGLEPLFTVKVPLLGVQYVLDSRKGLTQWFIEPIDKILGTKLGPDSKINSSISHEFYSQDIVPTTWKIDSVLMWMQRNYFSLPCQNIKILEDHRDHYLVNIFVTIGNSPNDTNTMFTRHFIAGGTKLVDVFEMLGRTGFDPTSMFVQLIWLWDLRKYITGTVYSYADAVKTQVVFRDVGWVGRLLWLLPARDLPSRLGTDHSQENEQNEAIAETNSS